MIESKKNGLTIFVNPTKLVGDVVVGICFPLACNGCAFNRLCGQSSCPSECFPQGAEEAALGFALMSNVRQVLCGDPLAVSKTKVGSVECVAHNGMLGINWKVKGTGSAIRKSLGLAIKVLDPGKVFPAYQRCIKQLGGSASKETFAYVADAATKSIKTDLVIGIVGNTKIDKDTLDAILEVVSKKHNPSVPKGNKTKPSDHTNCDHTQFTEVKVSGFGSAILSDYLRLKVKGLYPILCDKQLLLPMKESQWKTLSTKLRKGVKDYVQSRYSKVGGDLSAVFGYLTLSSGQLCASDVKSASSLSASTIEAAINKAI
jgi:hypothetical protein